MLKTRLAAAAAGLLLAGAVLSVAGPAFADGTTTSVPDPTTALAPCTTNTTAPLYTAKCAPTVSGTIGGAITVTLPGVGSITFNTTAAGVIDTSTQPSVSVIGQNFSAGTPKISADGTRITVEFVNIASPQQHYAISVKIAPPTSGTVPTLKAVAGPNGRGKHHPRPDVHKAKHPDPEGDNDADDQATSTTTGPAPLVTVQGEAGPEGPGGAGWQGGPPSHGTSQGQQGNGPAALGGAWNGHGHGGH
jgi:hypothetical protein